MTLNIEVGFPCGHKLLSIHPLESSSLYSMMKLQPGHYSKGQLQVPTSRPTSGTKRPLPHTAATRTLAKKKIKKSVSFSNYASVVVSTVPRNDIKDRWLQPEDYLEIERRRRDTVYAVLEAKGDVRYLDDEEHCLRGLEHQLSPQQCVRRRNTNMSYRKLLIEEQGIQASCGLKDPEALRNLSELFSKQSTTQARIRALID